MLTSSRVFVYLSVAVLFNTRVQADVLRLISIPIILSRPTDVTNNPANPVANLDLSASSISQVGGFVGAEVAPPHKAEQNATKLDSQAARFTLQLSQLVNTQSTSVDLVVDSTVFGTRTTAHPKMTRTITVTVDESVTTMSSAATKAPCPDRTKHSPSTALTFATASVSKPTSTITISVGTTSLPTFSLVTAPASKPSVTLVTVTSLLTSTATLLQGAATTYVGSSSLSMTTSTSRKIGPAMTGSNSTAIFTLASQPASAIPAMQTTNSAAGFPLGVELMLVVLLFSVWRGV